MKKFLISLVALFAVGCGDAYEGDLYEGGDAGAELGQTAQAHGAKKNGTVQYGTRSADSGLACNDSSSGQVCMLLRGITGTVANKKVEWRFSPAHGFTAAEQTAVRNAVTALDNTLSKWTFVEVSGGAPAIQIGRATVSGSSSSNNIDAFRKVRWDLPVDLTEGAGVVGAYKDASAVISIDIADIVARGAVEEAKVAGNQGEEGKLRTHAILSAFMAVIGAGTRDDASSAGTYHDRTLVFPGPLFRPLASTGSLCQMNDLDHFTNGQFNLITPGC